MRILLVARHFLEQDSTGALRPRAMARYLPASGVEVTVLCYRPQREDVTFDGNVIGVRDVAFGSAPLPTVVAWRLWQRGLRTLGFHRGVLERWRDVAVAHADEILAASRPDLIVATYPPAQALEIGIALSRHGKVPLACDFRDGLLFEPLETEALRSGATRRAYEALEREAVAASRTLITVSEPISAYFRDRHGHPDVFTLSNGFDPDDVRPDPGVALPGDAFHLVHTGRLAYSRASTARRGHGLEALVAAIELLAARDPGAARSLRLHLVGLLSPEEVALVTPLVERGTVVVWGQQSRARALAFQRRADALLLATAPGQASIATGKLFEYLAAGKPILALARGSEAARIVLETGTGRVVGTDDPEEIATALAALLSGAGQPERDEARVAAYSRPAQMRRLAERLVRT